MKKIKSRISIILILIIILIVINCIINGFVLKDKLVKVGNKLNLESIYENNANVIENIKYKTLYILLFPWNTISGIQPYYARFNNDIFQTSTIDSSNKVEDSIKTDGEYTYSISDSNVVITDVRDASNPVVISKIASKSPEEILLYNTELIIINSSSTEDTEVEIYNIDDKEKPTKIKRFCLNQDYYTSRIINDKLYVISTGYLKKDADGVITNYTEDAETKNIGYKNIFYFKGNASSYETVISQINLKEENSEFDVKAYLVDIENIYFSENNIYLVEETLSKSNALKTIASIFGIEGVFGFERPQYTYQTKIHQFELKEDGKIKYVTSTITEEKNRERVI